jgi:hypothetical protein
MNLLENDTTEFIKQSIIETQEQIRVFLSEIESCKDYIEEAENELKRRET